MIKLSKGFLLLILGISVIVLVGVGFVLHETSTSNGTTAKTSANNSDDEWKKSQFKVKTIADVKKAAKTNNVLVLFTNDPNKKAISSETKQVILDLEKKYPHHIPTVITAGYVRPTEFGLTNSNRDTLLYPSSQLRSSMLSNWPEHYDIAIGINKGWSGESETSNDTENGSMIYKDGESDLAQRYFNHGLDAQMYWYKEDSKY